MGKKCEVCCSKGSDWVLERWWLLRVKVWRLRNSIDGVARQRSGGDEMTCGFLVKNRVVLVS